MLVVALQIFHRQRWWAQNCEDENWRRGQFVKLLRVWDREKDNCDNFSKSKALKCRLPAVKFSSGKDFKYSRSRLLLPFAKWNWRKMVPHSLESVEEFWGIILNSDMFSSSSQIVSCLVSVAGIQRFLALIATNCSHWLSRGKGTIQWHFLIMLKTTSTIIIIVNFKITIIIFKIFFIIFKILIMMFNMIIASFKIIIIIFKMILKIVKIVIIISKIVIVMFTMMITSNIIIMIKR